MIKVWLVSHYAMPPHLELRVKTLRFAQILQSRGYEVLLITASTIHDTDINLIKSKEKFIEREYGGLKYVHLKCAQYKGSGLKRIKNLFQFQKQFNRVMPKFEKPDVIVADCNCINYKGILKFAQKHKIPFVSEIRDLWPLSIVEYKGISENNPLIRYLYKHERRMYMHSSAVIFSMEGGKDYIKEKKWDKFINLDKVFYINNGLDVAVQEKQKQENSLQDEDLADDKFKVVYTGSIRTVNSVDQLVRTAELLQDKQDIKFLIYGDGDKRKELEEYCENNNFTNVKFKGKVDKKFIPYICANASVNVISVKQTRISKYGVSWNKLFDYMAAGKPVLSTAKVNYDLIEKYKCGISLEEQSPQAISNAILQLYGMAKVKYEELCQNAKNAAKDFDFEILTNRLEEAIDYAIEHYKR